jgi:methenyltetrahydromethanopterin cyclohydrolase
MLENGMEEGLVVRAEPLEWAEEISHTMVEVERLEDGALLLDVDPSWAGAINAVLVSKGVRVSELIAAARLPELTAA